MEMMLDFLLKRSDRDFGNFLSSCLLASHSFLVAHKFLVLFFGIYSASLVSSTRLLMASSVSQSEAPPEENENDLTKK